MITKSQNGKHFPNTKAKKEQSQNNEFNLDNIKILCKKQQQNTPSVGVGGRKEQAGRKLLLRIRENGSICNNSYKRTFKR